MSRFPSALPSSAPTTTAHLVQQRLRRLPLNHQIRHRVRVLFVAVAGLADSILELHPTTLLNHMSSLVRRGMQVRRLLEPNAIPGRIRPSPNRITRGARRPPHMRQHVRHVMATERLLNPLQMRKRRSGPRHPALRSVVHLRRVLAPLDAGNRSPRLEQRPIERAALHFGRAQRSRDSVRRVVGASRAPSRRFRAAPLHGQPAPRDLPRALLWTSVLHASSLARRLGSTGRVPIGQ